MNVNFYFSAADMADKLQLMCSFLPPGGLFRCAAREKAWSVFHQQQSNLVSAIFPLVRHKQLSSFLTLKIVERILSPSQFSSSTPPSVTITSEEEDILIYIGGFVLFRCKSMFNSDLACLSVVQQTMKENEKLSSKLIQAKTRGGLCEPKNDMISFFLQIETIFRQKFDSLVNLSFQTFLESVCSQDDLLSLFFTCTCKDVDEKAQETVLLRILSVFFSS